MVTMSSIRSALGAGGLALSLTAGDGVASAGPDPIVSTTCSYSQVVAALNAQDPAAAQQFAANPAAQTWLGTFLASPPDRRRQMLQQAQGLPPAQQYAGTVVEVANTCNSY